ncbi:tRNA glutamyl-Q(34) synthetase GluQRS [Parasphingorhabdus sp.]|uniref:tRNA glutamyl-Q(34) synthetase GluQRS n=1 Tax=Parasphingorhabdus sp. TaxID=2709688 RepID=UPI00326374F3
MQQDVVVRFAPSPNGLLHMGHAYAAIVAHDFARNKGGRVLLRMEDIDIQRSRPEYTDAILEDMRWLGLIFDEEVIYQSRRFKDYDAALQRLIRMGVTYPCFCTRSELRTVHEKGKAEIGPDGPIYPGTCRGLSADEAANRMQSEAFCLRLDAEKVAQQCGRLVWNDEYRGEQFADHAVLGDVIIQPKDTPVSYHVAVSLDDARDGISHVVRGKDLLASTHVHRFLQALLELPTPDYVHHPVLLDETGYKLGKSRNSASLAILRQGGIDGQKLADQLRENIFPVGITLSKD